MLQRENESAAKPLKCRPMNLKSAFLMILLLALGMGSALSGEHWRDLPPEERREIRKQMREHWLREYHGQHPEKGEKPVHWKDLPVEERRRLRDEMREQYRREGGKGKEPRDPDKSISYCPRLAEPVVETISG